MPSGELRRRLFVCLLTAGGLAPTVAVAQDASVSEQAQELQQRGDLARARSLYETLAADPDARTAAEGLYRLGALSDETYAFRDALRYYQQSVARDPSSRYAARAIARSEDLEAHHEGAFVPLSELERLRRDPVRANNPADIEAMEHRAEGFPQGPVRAEALLLVGDAYIGRLNRPRDAARVFARLAQEPGADDNLRELAATRLVEARAILGEESLAVTEVAHVHATAEVQANAQTLARRKRLHAAALTTLSLAALAALVVTAYTLSQRWTAKVWAVWKRPLPLAHIAVLSLGGALMAWKADGHSGGPFYALGAGTLALHLLGSAWNAVGSQHPAHRALRAALGLLGVLAVAFLAMESLDTMMLEGIKL